MPLRAKDVDSITFPTAIRDYSEHAVEEFVDQVKTSLGVAEAALAEARAEAAVDAGADSDLQQPVPAAARLLQIAQTAAEQDAARIMQTARATESAVQNQSTSYSKCRQVPAESVEEGRRLVPGAADTPPISGRAARQPDERSAQRRAEQPLGDTPRSLDLSVPLVRNN
jgi:DivIVA domain-containing protein